MGLKRCLFACLLALPGVGTAAAMGASTQDPTAPHATIDSGSHGGGAVDEGSSAESDRTLPGSNGGSVDSSEGAGGVGSTAHPRASRRSSLGWQSLLPGSIQ